MQSSCFARAHACVSLGMDRTQVQLGSQTKPRHKPLPLVSYVLCAPAGIRMHSGPVARRLAATVPTCPSGTSSVKAACSRQNRGTFACRRCAGGRNRQAGTRVANTVQHPTGPRFPRPPALSRRVLAPDTLRQAATMPRNVHHSLGHATVQRGLRCITASGGERGGQQSQHARRCSTKRKIGAARPVQAQRRRTARLRFRCARSHLALPPLLMRSHGRPSSHRPAIGRQSRRRICRGTWRPETPP